MPWLGYFALMDAADMFVYRDDIALVENSQHANCRIDSRQSDFSLTPLLGKKSKQGKLRQVRFAKSYKHNKCMKHIREHLGDAPHYEFTEFVLQRAYSESDGFLCRFNTGILERIADATGIKSKRLFATELEVDQEKNELPLLTICQKLKATHFLTPLSSYRDFAINNPFATSDIALRFQNFNHPHYPQAGKTFAPNMACIDALSWVGPEKFLALVREGICEPFAIKQLNDPRAA